jgi:two-component system, NtrC family, sensor kinase
VPTLHFVAYPYENRCNNPVSFIHGNLSYIDESTHDLLELLKLYQHNYPHPSEQIQVKLQDLDLDFLDEDLVRALQSMKEGTNRIRQIVLSLRNFSRLDESDLKEVDIHEGMDSTIMIVQHRLQHRLQAHPDYPEITITKDYDSLSRVECYAGQLNQVFMNVLNNAIDAVEERDRILLLDEIKSNPGTIQIWTEAIAKKWVAIHIADNGLGMAGEVRSRIFDPFFTTKPVGKGTGLGLSTSYQIITEKHGGKLYCHSTPGQGTEFAIEIPIRQA